MLAPTSHNVFAAVFDESFAHIPDQNNDRSATAAAPSAAPASAAAAAAAERGNEFQRIWEFPKVLTTAREEYPLITLITMVMSAVLGFFNVLHIFSPTAVLGGAMLLGLASSLFLNARRETGGIWILIASAIRELQSIAFTAKKVAN